MSLPQFDAYGHMLNFYTDGVSDYYIVGGSTTYTFPVGTPVPAVMVSLAIQENISSTKQQVQDYIQTKYSRDQQIQLVMLYLSAQAGGLTNRQAYIAQTLTWLNGIISNLATYVASVQSMTNPSVIAATSIDTTLFQIDPGVTVLAAIQIGN